ncbi:MAG: hypothetical protein IJZ04_03775 [Clostridia bacterium]|nr:hypothetical protein [Clostridia bacterium]
MTKIKSTLIEILKSSYLPLIIFAVIVAIYHTTLPLLFADDAWFYNILEGKDDIFTACRDFLEYRYNEWSSRTLIELALILLVRVPLLWKIIDTVAIVYVVCAIASLINPEKSRTKNIILCLVALIFPPVLFEVGSVATSINYIIPFSAALVGISVMYKRFAQMSVSRVEQALSIPLLIFACFSEILSATVLLITLGCGAYYIIKNKKIPVWEIVYAVICILALIYHLTCEGNDARYALESVSWLPEHPNLNLFFKVELGFCAMMQTLFLTDKGFFSVFCLSISIIVTLKSRKWYNIVIAWLPSAFSLIFGTMYSLFGKIPPVTALKNHMLAACGHPNITRNAVICDIVFVLLLVCIMYSLRVVISDNKKYLSVFYILFCGAASKMSLGLSPTVWTSSGRGATFLYIAIGIISTLMISETVKHLTPHIKHLIEVFKNRTKQQEKSEQ